MSAGPASDPGGATPDVAVDALARRSFLKRMAAALALAGAGGCRRAPGGTILPYVSQPPEVEPGNPLFYATAFPLEGYAQGVLVASREGRPVKVEGNPDHPASLGAAGRFEQATLLGLYDPDRMQAAQRAGTPATWREAVRAITSRPWKDSRGRGLSIVLEPTGSAVIDDRVARLRTALPELDLRFFSAVPRTATWEGTRAAFGRVLEPRYHLHAADVVLVLDDDPVARGPAWMRWARGFADRRRAPERGMSRVYVIEPRLTPTGASADHRLAVRRSDVAGVTAAILAAIAPDDLVRMPGVAAALRTWRDRARRNERWIEAVARDLVAHRGRGLIVVGDAQPAEVHVMAHAIDAALNNLGRAKTFGASPILEAGSASHDLRPLAAALEAGAVDTLVVMGPNIAYAAPRDLRLGERIRSARESLYLGDYDDETAHACTWSAPLAHVLETWADVRAFDGTRSIVQPLLAPLRDCHTAAQGLAALEGDPGADPYLLTRRSMGPLLGGPFDAAWEEVLARGIVGGSATADLAVAPHWGAVADALARLPRPAPDDALELALDVDLRVYDGRFTNVAWLAELPEPLTTMAWGNALVVGDATANRLGLREGQVAAVATPDRALHVPVLVAAGQAEGQLSLTFGWGRAGDLSVASGHGVDAFALRTTDAPWSVPVSVQATAETQPLAIVQRTQSLHGRDESIAPHGTVDDLRSRGRVGSAPENRPVALYANRPAGTRQWGMVVDLNACTACSACVVACQAENNVPTVGFANVRKGRAMYWLAVNVYHDGDRTIAQPMLCQHCEQAPCEYVCPVGATTHSADGINEMTYNRCVGTRFCSNNCPYKVRRFNWFNFHGNEAAVESLVHNPDVTVRARGVMEKCNYCVQRIRRAEIRATVEGRDLRDGDVRTACQQACPTRAIVFGDIADPASEVTRLRDDRTRLYAVLDELGTVPRTRYLARITNPNPELA